MEKLHSNETDELFRAILSLATVEECYAFFEDACTVREIREIARRFKVARLLSEGANYAEIEQKTEMSTATISRVSRCLEYGSGGYRTVLDRLKEAGSK